MADETTGQGQAATPGEGGVTGNGEDTQPSAGAPAPQAGGEQAQALQDQLDEQRKIQQGLDRRVAQLNQQLTVAQQEKDNLAQQLEALQGKSGAEGEELETLRQKVTAYDAEKADLTAQLEATQQEAERIKLVAAEFPALAPLIDQGALPQAADMDEFRAKLDGLNTAFANQAKVQFENMAQGVKPPASPPAGAQPDTNALHKDMLAALRANDMETYNTLREQWYAATENIK